MKTSHLIHQPGAPVSFRKAVLPSIAAGSMAILTACSSTDATGVAPASTATIPGNSAVKPSQRGFVWTPEAGLKEIPLPYFANGMDVTAMNDLGQVVGSVTRGEGTENYRAFIWSVSDGFSTLGSLVGPDGISMALHVSNSGEVTGLSEGPSAILDGGPMGVYLGDAFVWTPQGGMKPAVITLGFPGFESVSAGGNLGLPPGSDCLRVVAVNGNRQALGYAGSTTAANSRQDPGAGSECHFTTAALWEADGKYVAINDCGSRPWCGTQVTSLNNRGEVVGYRDDTGFRWTSSGGFVPIPVTRAVVNVINDNGDAAGAVWEDQISIPIVWTASGEVKTIKLPEGSTSGYAVAINQKGEVTGNFR